MVKTITRDSSAWTKINAPFEAVENQAFRVLIKRPFRPIFFYAFVCKEPLISIDPAYSCLAATVFPAGTFNPTETYLRGIIP